MENVILVIHLILAICLIGVVLLQRSEGGGLGMGSGGAGGMAAGIAVVEAIKKAGSTVTEALITAKVVPGKEDAGAKFSDYFDHCEAWGKIPSHRALAILRAAKEEVVTVDIAPDPETGAARAVNMVAAAIGISGDGPGDDWLRKAAGWTWRVKLSLSMFMDLLTDLRRRSHATAIDVFARNLRDLLLAAPAGARTRDHHKRRWTAGGCLLPIAIVKKQAGSLGI